MLHFFLWHIGTLPHVGRHGKSPHRKEQLGVQGSRCHACKKGVGPALDHDAARTPNSGGTAFEFLNWYVVFLENDHVRASNREKLQFWPSIGPF
jgi:hypothetical protein